MYELLYIVPAPFTEKDLDGISKKIKKFISDLDGKVIKEKNLGNKKLAYLIEHIHRGFYLLVNFEMDEEKIKDLDTKLKLTPESLRHMIIKVIVLKSSVVKRKDGADFARDKKDSGVEKYKEKTDEKKDKKIKKIDLKKLGEKIDNLLKI